MSEEYSEEDKLLEDSRIVYNAVTSGKLITKQSELYRFMNALTGEIVPFTPCCKGHQTPWQMIWDCYKADLPKYKGKSRDIVAIGPREGFKTLSTSKLNAIELLLKPKVEIASIGAIVKQATRCYKFTSKYLYHPVLAEMNKVIKNVMEETILDTGSRYEQLVGTITGVNSPHPNKLRADEVDLMKEDVVEEMKMVSSSYNGWASHNLYTSTRKFVDGVMAGLASRAKVKGDSTPDLIIWCYKDVSEPCPDDRSGINSQIYEVEDIFHHGEKVVVSAFEYCGDCNILPSCRGDLKRSCGVIPIDDSIKKWNELDRDKWLAQKECIEPPRTSLFYYDWDEKFNVGKFDFNRAYPVDMFADFTGGGEDPSVFQFWQTWDDGNDYLILELIYRHRATSSVAFEVEQKCKEMGIRPSVMCGDSAQMQQIRDLKSASDFFANLRPIKKVDRKEGLSICKRRLKDNNGARHTFVNEPCINFRHEIKNLKRRQTDPDDHKEGDDHSMDTWRYRNIYRYHSIGEPRIRLLSLSDTDDDVQVDMKAEVITEKKGDHSSIFNSINRYLAEDND